MSRKSGRDVSAKREGKRGAFDAAAFYAALDSARAERELTWKGVSKETGVSASTFTRMAQGRRPDVDSMAALLAWSGLSADDFVRDRRVEPAEPDTLAQITAYLRADRTLSPRAADAIEKVLRATYEHLKEEA